MVFIWLQDYMDRVTLSQAVNSICGPESSNNYMNIDNDLMYIDQSVSSNVLDPIPFKDDISSSYTTSAANSINDNSGEGIGTSMSQYVNALKSAGLPTDLPILFESGDGSYINVNEQVLLDMVQSSEIQYEVIDQPNIIEKVSDPSEIKSIDDLSKSIERGEMILSNKSYSQNDDYKDSTQFDRPEDSMPSLNTILPDNLESFGEQQNYVVSDRLQENTSSLDHENPEFSCIDGDLQYFTKSMSDDVKKFYVDQQLSEAGVMEQLCPNSSSLEANYNMSLLDAKSSQMNESLNQQFTSLNTEAMRRSEDCYDFSLQLPQRVFKDDLDCLIATPRRNDDDSNSFAKAKEEIIKDLMSIESKMKINAASANTDGDMLTPEGQNHDTAQNVDASNADLSSSVTTSGLQWDGYDINDESCRNDVEGTAILNHGSDHGVETTETTFQKSKPDNWDTMSIINESEIEKNGNEEAQTDKMLNSDLDSNIPYAVGLLSMKHAQQNEEPSQLKRKHSVELDLLDNIDGNCLKRKAKKKM